MLVPLVTPNLARIASEAVNRLCLWRRISYPARDFACDLELGSHLAAWFVLAHSLPRESSFTGAHDWWKSPMFLVDREIVYALESPRRPVGRSPAMVGTDSRSQPPPRPGCTEPAAVSLHVPPTAIIPWSGSEMTSRRPWRYILGCYVPLRGPTTGSRPGPDHSGQDSQEQPWTGGPP